MTGFVSLWRAGGEPAAGDLEDDRVNGRDRRDRRRVDQPALDDDLDVHQAVADDGRRERERHEAEQHGRQLEARRRREAERERQRVAEHERQRAEPGAPDDPAQLPARRDRAHARERARHDHQSADEAEREIEQLGALDERRGRSSGYRRVDRREGSVATLAPHRAAAPAGRRAAAGCGPRSLRAQLSGRSGKTSAKWTKSGGRSSIATTSPQ